MAIGWGIVTVVRADDAAADHPAGTPLAPSNDGHGDQAGGGNGGTADDHGESGHGSVDYNKPPLEPHIPLFIWSLVTFLVFLFLAKKLAWLPMIEGLNARESRVNRALAEAEAARIEALKLLEDHKAHLDEITEQVKEIIAQARTDAEQEKARIITEAEAETVAMRDAAIADIHEAREQALSGMDERIGNQVDMATRHVLG